LRRCHAVTRRAFPEVLKQFPRGQGRSAQAFPNPGQFPTNPGQFPTFNPPQPQPTFGFEPDVRKCGQALLPRLGTLRALLTGRVVPRASRLDLWPVLRFEPGNVDNVYDHDYVLLVDLGGNDTYLNNAGGNALDVWRGPPGSGAPIIAPARGCIDAFDIIRPRTCFLGSAAVLDLAGNDRFGRLEPPDPATDGICTASPVQRRIFVQGTGVAGVGVLIKQGGNSTYIGKVLTTGAGHIGGFGYLEDDGGSDSYTAIRTSMGSAIVGGVGTLIDRGGDAHFDYYVPAPLDPAAPNLSPGAGGVRDDLDRCNRAVSGNLGAGQIGGLGIFAHDGGNNTYNAPITSLGAGSLGGFGSFVDSGGGSDTYSGPGAVGRGNNITLFPTPQNAGFFQDR
jgi:hypothetical protein